jgi:hypothetical protein
MKRLLMMSALATALSSSAFGQGQPGGGWWGDWNYWGMGPGYGMWQGAPGMMPPGPGMGGGWQGMGGGGGMMAAMDANQDGTISAEEAAAHAEFMFEAMDGDQDGVLVAGEFGSGRMDMMRTMQPAMSARMQERRAARFAAKDGDGDGQVTMAEFLAAEKAQYEAADTDGDGKVTPWELRGQMWQ